MLRQPPGPRRLRWLLSRPSSRATQRWRRLSAHCTPNDDVHTCKLTLAASAHASAVLFNKEGNGDGETLQGGLQVCALGELPCIKEGV